MNNDLEKVAAVLILSELIKKQAAQQAQQPDNLKEIIGMMSEQERLHELGKIDQMLAMLDNSSLEGQDGKMDPSVMGSLLDILYERDGAKQAAYLGAMILQKQANDLRKEAGIKSEIAGAILSPGSSGIGAITALFRKKPNLLEYLIRNSKTWSNAIPGVGGHRLVMRAKGKPFGAQIAGKTSDELVKLIETLTKQLK